MTVEKEGGATSMDTENNIMDPTSPADEPQTNGSSGCGPLHDTLILGGKAIII